MTGQSFHSKRPVSWTLPVPPVSLHAGLQSLKFSSWHTHRHDNLFPRYLLSYSSSVHASEEPWLHQLPHPHHECDRNECYESAFLTVFCDSSFQKSGPPLTLLPLHWFSQFRFRSLTWQLQSLQLYPSSSWYPFFSDFYFVHMTTKCTPQNSIRTVCYSGGSDKILCRAIML